MLTVAAMVVLGACGTGAGTDTTTVETIAAGTTGGASDKTPDPTTPNVAIVSIYTISGDGSGLNQEMDAIDSLDATLLMKKLVEYQVVGTDTSVTDFSNNDGVAVLNLSALAKQDKQTIGAVANTYIENFNLKKLTIQVSGKAVSGASDLTYIHDYKTYNPDGSTKAATETTSAKTKVIKRETLAATSAASAETSSKALEPSGN